MSLVLAHARAETLQFARYPAYSLPTVLFPAVLLLLFGRQFEHGEPGRLLAGFAATALLSVVFFQFGVGIATSRTTPWETYLRTLPVTPAARLGGRVLSALAFAAATVGTVVVVATTVYGVGMPLWRWCALGFALLAGSVPFALLGIGFGYWLPPRAALPVANVLFLPLAVGGSLWVRPTKEQIPGGVGLASQCLPTRSWIEVLDSVATGDSPLPLHHVGALTGWTAAFFGFAWLGYRRDEGERFS
jgi:ABC-2 type transport system permease protein